MSLGGIFALGGAIIFIMFLIFIALYLLFAFGLYTLGQKQKIENNWLAFIPVAQLYVLGKLIKEIKLQQYVVPNHELVLPGAVLAYMIFSKVPVLGFLTWLASIILTVAAIYYLYKRYKGDKAVVMTVLSVVLPFMGPVYIFNMRNDDPLDAEQKVIV